MVVVVRVCASLALVIVETSEVVVSRSGLRLFAVEASLILKVVLVEVEISNDSSTTQVLALTVVAVAEVGKPNFREGLKVILADGKNFLMNNPVYDICARRVCQGSLVVIEWVHLESRRSGQLLSLVRELLLDSSHLRRSKSVEEFSEVNLFNQTEVEGAKLLDEGVAVIGNLE